MLQVALAKVCDANFWSSQALALEPEKSWLPFPQPKEPKKWKFDIPHHCDKSPKMLQVALPKSV